MIIHHNKILGVILCGGRNSRMEYQPKWDLSLGKTTILEEVLNGLKPQVDTVVLNGSDDSLQKYSLPLVADSVEGFQGPLAGILSGLEYAEANNYEWVATCPCDVPVFPEDMVKKLKIAIETESTYCSVIQYQERVQGVFGLWHLSMKEHLHTFLKNTNTRAIHQFLTEAPNHSIVNINDTNPITFFNINTLNDWQTVKGAQRKYPK